MASSTLGGVIITQLDPPGPPSWVNEVLGPEAREQPAVERAGLVVHLEEARETSFLRAVTPGARDLDDPAFLAAAEHIYASIGAILRERGESPLRLWNYVPEIRARAPDGASRYEIFNAGRAAGFKDWSTAGAAGRWFAPSTGVGHRGDDLVVHVLAGRKSSTPVENPRQIPAYRYSRRYGPVPPSFSRAAVLEPPASPWPGRRMALSSGTASIVGEDSRHPGDVEAQLCETLLNLACLSATLAGERLPADAGLGEDLLRALSRYRELRAYVVRHEDAGAVLTALRHAFPKLRRLELASADLCRPELLVEVEGIFSPDA